MDNLKPLIYSKMSSVMLEIGAIGKNQKNVAQGFKFRGIDDFINSLYPALTKHGVFMAPRCTAAEHEVREVTRSNGKQAIDKLVTIMMEYDFYAEDGSKVTIGPIPAEGLDSGDKATNKALSAALKYALIQTFSIPTEDMSDGDSESPTFTTVDKKEEKTPSDKTSRFARKSNDKSKDTAKQPEAELVKDAPETSQDSSQATPPTDEAQDKQAPTKTSFRRFKRG